MKKKCFSILIIIAAGMVMFSDVKAQSSADSKESARVFVQKFYDWYLVLWAQAQEHQSRFSTREVAVSQKPEYFDRALRTALAEDDSVQNNSGDIVGLDFDAFLRCQELWGGYQTGNVKQAGDTFLVDIRNIEKGKSKKAILAADLRVVAKVVNVNGHWVFKDFIYPSASGNQNLLTILKDLQKDRNKTK